MDDDDNEVQVAASSLKSSMVRVITMKKSIITFTAVFTLTQYYAAGQ